MRFRPFLFLLALVLLFLVTLNAQEAASVLPRVIDHAPIVYPAIARSAHVGGPVRLKITTDGHAVSSVEVVDGPPLLVKAATDNVKTWKFVDHTPGTFEVTFDFKLLENETTFLAEPGVVDIAVLPPGSDGNTSKRLDYTPPVDWDLELKTASDNIKALLTLWTYGQWLRGYTLGSRNQERDLGNPHLDGNMLGFDALLDDSFGQRLWFSLVGKKSGDKIQGIFLDAWGKSGTWTAVPSKAVAPDCPAPSAAAEENIIPVPDITQHRQPHYPPLLWEAQIQGQFRMRVTTDSYCVAKITTDSSEPLLAQAAETNVRTWWFASHKPGTFNLTFNYRILEPVVSFFEKPGVVEISALPLTLGGPESGLWNDGGYSPEIWKAQLISPHGDMRATFKFKYGCCEEGDATDAKGKNEKITQGFRSDHEVGFSTIITIANGRQTRVSFVGILRSDDRIQGVFLDESGTAGTWSAQLISHGSPNIYD
ncbi:MAG: energy transducer TonB [Candidatus Acidiferrales bacterium]